MKLKEIEIVSVDWSYYNEPVFDEMNDKYLPKRGEGDNKATQAVTAVNKLIYKWYNDGDVFDNTAYLDGWMNDLSPYANWLYKYTNVGNILYGVFDCRNDSDYEDLLKKVADEIFDPEYLAELEKDHAVGSVYSCAGPFMLHEYKEDDYEEDDWNDRTDDYDDEGY